MLKWFLDHQCADEALEGVWGFFNKITVLAPQEGDPGDFDFAIGGHAMLHTIYNS